MLGQFLVEPELELELGELEEPELDELEPALPVFPALEPVFELEPELVLGVEVDVVAALATNAPPARRPVVNAPTASTFRKRSCMDGMPFVSGATPAVRGHSSACASNLWADAERRRRVGGVALRTDDDSQEPVFT
jgi:hypothetical protein